MTSLTSVKTGPVDDVLLKVAGDVAKLDAAYPIVLLPVQVETCFRLGGLAAFDPELLVRVYPDEIMAYSHQPALTIGEQQAGRDYWSSVGGGGTKLDAWRTLLNQYESTRAAWIVRSTAPGVAGGETSAGAWAQAVEARGLPDRWLALAYRGSNEVARALSAPVQEPVALSLDPSVDPSTDPDSVTDVSGDGLFLDTALLWTVDFERAKAAGMAFSIPLKSEDLAQGFDRLVVLGVPKSLTPQDGATQLAELLDGAHFTRGVAFVTKGTPTNSTSAAPSGFPPDDTGGSASFAVECGPALTAPGSDGTRFTLALGVPTEVAEHVVGADRTEYQYARAMSDALWPATLGYFLEQIMAPVFDQDAIRAARRHIVDYVVGRGPLAAFRVEATPYGVLPVSSLDRWQPRGGASGVDMHLPKELVTLRRIWKARIPKVPQVGRTDDPDADLLAVLGMDASTREVRVRTAFGRDFQWNLAQFLGVDWDQLSRAQRIVGERVLTLLAHPEWNPRVLGIMFGKDSTLFGQPFVTDAPLSEHEPLDFDYVRWIRTASIDELKTETFPPSVTQPTALFYTILRVATLREYARVAFDLLIQYGLATEADRHEAELVGVVDGTETRPTIWDWLERPIPALTGSLPLSKYLIQSQLASGRGGPGTEDITAYHASLAALVGLPTAELHRLFTETMDVSSHRLDAYLTSLPSKRLDEMRRAQPLGSYIGAYAWVEDLRPQPASSYREVALPDGRRARVQANGAGHVHAPSVDHAQAAAVLRNAYLSRTGEDRLRYAIDLSSERVRTARRLLASVRAGQSLSVLLGYGVERGLHDAQLDQYIEPLRQLYPLVASVLANGGAAPNGTSETIAPRNVVDGLALRAAWHDGAVPFSGNKGLPEDGADRAGVEAQLRRLDDVVDAATDLLTAESVYQLVHGGTAAAAATLDAMAQGVRPPDPEIARQPRSGTVLTHRVAIVLGTPPMAETEGWPPMRRPRVTTSTHPRAEAEPHLDAWVGALLGDPRSVKCRVNYLDPTDADPTRRTDREVTLAALDLRPIEVLALAQDAALAAQASELDLRVAYVALADARERTDVRIDYARDEAHWDRTSVRTFPEVLELMRAVKALLGQGRPLRPEDLLLPETHSPAVPADRLAPAALSRATDAEKSLRAAQQDLADAVIQVKNAGASPTPNEVKALRDTLLGAASFGIGGALPMTRKGVAAPVVKALLSQAARVQEEIDRRVTTAGAVVVPAASDASGTLEAAAAKLRAVFGPDFLVLPTFKPADPSALDAALAAGPKIGADASAVLKWMQQAAQVRPSLERWRTLGLLAGALKADGATYDVAKYDLAQLPSVPGEQWVALPFASERERPPAGRLSLVLHRPAKPTASDEWTGLLLDEWPELIPSAAERTGIAFHYDNPGAEAAQTLLIAVTPTEEPTWDLMALVDIVNETLDLAKVRAVDGELLGALSQILPGIYLASNVSDDTVSTDLTDDVVTDAKVGEPDAGDNNKKKNRENKGRKPPRGEEG